MQLSTKIIRLTGKALLRQYSQNLCRQHIQHKLVFAVTIHLAGKPLLCQFNHLLKVVSNTIVAAAFIQRIIQ